MARQKTARPHRDVPDRRRLDATSAEEFAAFAETVRRQMPDSAQMSDREIRAELEQAIDWLAPDPTVASTPIGYMAQQAMSGDEACRDFFRGYALSEQHVTAEELDDARSCLWAIMTAQRETSAQ